MSFARRLSKSVIELLPPVQVNLHAVALMSRDADQLGPASTFLMDVSSVDEFDPDAFPGITKAIRHARVRRLVLISSSPMQRILIASALSTAPVRSELFETRIDALRAAGIG